MPKKQVLLYGLLLATLLLLLQVIQYRVNVRNLPIELFGGLVALIFLGIGIWIGIIIYQKKSLSGKYVDKRLGLSNREMEVLELLAEGYSNQEIGDKLFVSLNTIKTHISSIYQKLNVQRRTQAIQRARELQLIIRSN